MAVVLYVMLPLIINAVYLFLLLGAASYAIYGVSHYSSSYLLIACFISMVIVNVICLSNLVTQIILKVKLTRNPTTSEAERLTGLVSNIIKRINQSYATNYLLEQFQIKIVTNPAIEYFALGKKYIVLSHGSLDALDDNQLEVVIAHAIGTLYLRLGGSSNLMLVNQLIADKFTQLFMLSISLLRVSYKFFSRLNKILAVAVLIILLVIGLVLSPILLVILTGNLIVQLMVALFSKYCLITSDKFVVNLGLKDSLLTVLEQLQATSIVKDGNLFTKYCAQQISPTVRITNLDKQ